jgi:cytochrome c-type biogenesis protein CcmH/NrfG
MFMTPEQLHQTYREAMNLSLSVDQMMMRGEPIDQARIVMAQAIEKMALCAECLRDKLDCQPTRAVIFRALGSMYMCFSMYDKAIETFKEALVCCLDGYEKDVINELINKCQDETN